uniref:Uncharacterized protein n=1 Tax=Oryza brachyantha TaxID=4533 RepID=J3M7F9_ORYBR
SRASSAERRDIHNKPCLETQAGVLASEKDRNAATTMSPKTEEEIRKPWWYNESKRFAAEAPAKFAGPSFASPEPCMLPLPNFLKA